MYIHVVVCVETGTWCLVIMVLCLSNLFVKVRYVINLLISKLLVSWFSDRLVHVG